MAGAQITEIKTTLAGERKTFSCELLHREPGEVVVVYRMPRDVQLEDVMLRADTLSLGYFREDRPYNAYHWVDAGLDTVALYFNISDRTRIGDDSVAWRDLAVDVLITAELCHDPLSRLNEYDKLSRSLLKRG